MEFEWDDNKKRKNFQKHGLNFEDAHLVFKSNLVVTEDKRKNYGETRYCALGVLEERIIFVVYTLRSSVIRIISMRKANAYERKIYQERLKEN